MKKRKPSRKMVIGLTGGFGTGKSTVAAILRSYGAKVIDADIIGHELLKPGTAVSAGITRAFGREVLENGRISRRKIAKKVFADKKSLSRFNRIVHPLIIASMKKRLSGIKNGVAVMDAPLLFETGLDRAADIVVVVKAGLENRIRRLRKRSGLTKTEIISRIRSQIPLKDKLGRADFIIDNNGTIEDTKKQAALIRRMLWRS